MKVNIQSPLLHSRPKKRKKKIKFRKVTKNPVPSNSKFLAPFSVYFMFLNLFLHFPFFSLSTYFFPSQFHSLSVSFSLSISEARKNFLIIFMSFLHFIHSTSSLIRPPSNVSLILSLSVAVLY